jgi:hypothetical protein
MTTGEELRYQQAVTEAKGLLGDQKALKGATAVCIFKNAQGFYFAVRATRAEPLKSEGFVEVARVDLGGNVLRLSNL